MDKISSSALPAGAPAPQPAFPAPPRDARRRVGTLSLGLALIACGLGVLAAYFVPDFPVLTALKLAPLVLVALGGEMVWHGLRQEAVRYDLLSLFITLILLGAGCLAALVPLAVDYYQPGRYETVRDHFSEQVDARLDGGKVWQADVYVSLSGRLGLTDQEALEEATASCEVELYGPYDTPEAFAADCLTQLQALEGVRLESVWFRWRNDQTEMTLEADPALARQASADLLAGRVQVETLAQGDSTAPAGEADEQAA